MKTIDDLLRTKNLTPKELEQFKELIEEFRENEKKIRENCDVTECSLKTFAQTMQVLAGGIVTLSKTLQRLLEEADTLSLKLMPSEKFYRE